MSSANLSDNCQRGCSRDSIFIISSNCVKVCDFKSSLLASAAKIPALRGAVLCPSGPLSSSRWLMGFFSVKVFLQFSKRAQWDILALVEPILGIQMHHLLLSKAYGMKLLI